MKICPKCQATNKPANRFCEQCGASLESGPPTDATLMWSATQMGTRGPQQTTFDLSALFRVKPRLIIGRAPDCDICLPHPSVSRYHAMLERRPEGTWLLDLVSVNGVWVSAQRISSEAVKLKEGDRVGIGPFILSLTEGLLHSLDNSRGLRLEARNLEKIVRTADGGRRKLLDNINLVVEPGEFVCLLGPSGSGKSTLMDALNGRRQATGGQVLANGENFYHHFDSFRQSLGYVPQKDIVHTQLTVYKALYYTARLRLPLDTEPDELRERIENVLQLMELVSHRDTLVGNLSGGQIKRVSLGAELLAEPSMLFIDEATSGLDAGTEARMMRLFRKLADEGRSLVCITHNVDNVEQCHLVIVLARGKLMYYGPPGEAPGYFGVQRISDIYDRLKDSELPHWEQEFSRSAQAQEYIAKRLEVPLPPPPPPTPTIVAPAPPVPGEEKPARLSGLLASPAKLMQNWQPLAEKFRHLTARMLRLREWLKPVKETWHQFRVLTARYLELIWSDKRGLRLLLLQAPIVALVLLIGFVGKPFRGPMPKLREMTAEERESLELVEALGKLGQKDKPLNDEQKKMLSRIKVSVAGVEKQVSLATLAEMLRDPDSLSAAQRKMLEEMRVTVEVKGKPVPVTGKKVMEAWRNIHKSRIPENMLAIEGNAVPYAQGISPRFPYVMLFVVVMIVMWFGCNNAAKEIVKEEAIYSRERAVNLRLLPYLASKFIVLGVITALHALLLMLILYGMLEVLAVNVDGHSTPSPTHMLNYIGQVLVIVLLCMAGVALGLLLSACVSNPDQANALLPYVLIPQMIIGGGILAVGTGLLYVLAVVLSPVYWAFRAVHLGANDVPPGFPGAGDYEDSMGLPCLALVVQTVLLLAATWWFMRQKERQH